MEGGDNTPLTLSRQDLYELAWSKPMADLAKDFGISDVGLAKRCRRLGIPVPGRGYWARIDAGQTPYKPKLPERKEQNQDRNALKVTPPAQPGVDVEPLAKPGDLTPIESGPSIPDRIAAIIVEPTKAIADTMLPVKRAARPHKHGKASDLIFGRGERVGAVIDLQVTSDALERALLLADTLLRTAEVLGWAFDDPKELSKVQGRESDKSEEPIGLKGRYGTSCSASMNSLSRSKSVEQKTSKMRGNAPSNKRAVRTGNRTKRPIKSSSSNWKPTPGPGTAPATCAATFKRPAAAWGQKSCPSPFARPPSIFLTGRMGISISLTHWSPRRVQAISRKARAATTITILKA